MLFVLPGIFDVFAIILHTTDLNLKMMTIMALNLVVPGIFYGPGKNKG